MMKPTKTKMNTMMTTMIMMMMSTMMIMTKMMVIKFLPFKFQFTFLKHNSYAEYDDEIAERVIGGDDDDDYDDDDDDDYDLDDDVYDTEGLFDGNEGKQDDEGLLHSNTLNENMLDENETELHNTSEL